MLDLALYRSPLTFQPEPTNDYHEFICSRGGATNDHWKDSWRLADEGRFGPVETVGIHFIHFALGQFGRCREAFIHTSSRGPNSAATDTGMISLSMDNGVWVNICNSYAAPYTVFMSVWGTNGYLHYDGEVARLYSPRDTLDQHGLFKSPPIAEEWSIDYQDAWQESLCRSQHALLEAAQRGDELNPEAFDRDVAAMSVLIRSSSQLIADSMTVTINECTQINQTL